MPCRNKTGVYSIIAAPFCWPETGEGGHEGQPRCLPSLRTRLKPGSCKKPEFSEHSPGAGQSGSLLLIPGSGSDLLGILQ